MNATGILFMYNFPGEELSAEISLSNPNPTQKGGTLCQAHVVGCQKWIHIFLHITFPWGPNRQSVTWTPNQKDVLWKGSLCCQGHWGEEEHKGILTFFFVLLSVAYMERELRHRDLRSRDLNLIKLSGGEVRQRKEDHGDKRSRDRKRGKGRTL